MKNLRILIYMNPVVVDKVSKRFLYWKDSGFIFTKNLIKSLPESYRYYWLIPENIVFADKNWFWETNKNIELIPYPYPTNVHQNRYEFHGKVLRDYFTYGMDIDVILNNQPEVTNSLKTWAANQRREKPVILSFYHWIDCKESRMFGEELGGFFWRQYEGYLNSDLSLFHNNYAYQLFMEEAMRYLKDIERREVTFFSPPPTIYGNSPISLPAKKIILFNHRLNNTTGWKEVVSMAANLYEKRQDFVLWLTDDSSIKAGDELLGLPYIYYQSVPSESYGYLLKHCHFSICNHKGYSTWNMAILDSFANGCLALMPYDGVYKDMFRDSPTDRIFHRYRDLEPCANRLLDQDSSEFLPLCRDVVESCACFNNKLSNIDSYIQGLINQRLPKRKPKGYDIVKYLIQSKPQCYKSDWVNDNWEFHTNSNFQLIRWILLKNGVIDDTGCRATRYIGSGKIEDFSLNEQLMLDGVVK